MDILAKYEEYAREGTDAPSKYHKYAGAALVGTVMGKRLWYSHGHTTIFPNLWVCLIGQSTLMKKSTSIRIAEHLLSKVNEELMLPAKFTVEKLYQVLADHPAGLITYSELQSLLSQMTRDFNAELKATLTDFFDSPPVRTYTTMGGGAVTVKHPAPTILAGSTIDWLVEAAKARDIAGGFYPRWLFVVAKESDQPDMPLPPPRNEAKASSIVNALSDILKTYRYELHDSGRMKMTPSAEKEYRLIYSDLKASYACNSLMGSFAGRAQVYILKLAMISAMGRKRSFSIEADDLTWAYQMTKDCMQDIANICAYEIADSKTDAHLNSYRKILRNAGAIGMTKRELFKNGPIRMPDYFEKLYKALLANGYAVPLPAKRKDSQLVVSMEIPAGQAAASGANGASGALEPHPNGAGMPQTGHILVPRV